MTEEIGFSDRVDNATMYAIFGAASAAGIGWTLGVPPKQAAIVAAISSFGSAIFCSPQDQETKVHGPRLPVTASLAAGVFILSKVTGLHQMNWISGLATVAAGAAGSTLLWSYSRTENMTRPKRYDCLPALAYPIVGFMIGVVRPQWFKPLHGAVFMGVLRTWRLSCGHCIELSKKSEKSRYVWTYLTDPIVFTAGMFTPLAATWLGFPTSYSPQWLILYVAEAVVDSLSRKRNS